MNPVSLFSAMLVALFFSFSDATAQFDSRSRTSTSDIGDHSESHNLERRPKTKRRTIWQHSKFSRRSVPSTVPIQWSKWKAILRERYPDRIESTVTAGKLIEDLRQIGLPIVLDETAIDDLLDEKEPISLPLPETPLEGRLTHALKLKNATFCFKRDHILIFSMDRDDDPDFGMTITYDISRMGLDPGELIDAIHDSIEPDSWQATGTGEGTIAYLHSRGRDLMIVSSTYQIHRAIEELLDGVDHLTGGRQVRNNRFSRVGIYTTSIHSVTPRTNALRMIFPVGSARD